jgi:hypothetical protein
MVMKVQIGEENDTKQDSLTAIGEETHQAFSRDYDPSAQRHGMPPLYRHE